MGELNIDAIRHEVRALDYVRGSSAEAATWREDDEDSRANLAIEGMDLAPDETALFDMLRDEAVQHVARDWLGRQSRRPLGKHQHARLCAAACHARRNHADAARPAPVAAAGRTPARGRENPLLRPARVRRPRGSGLNGRRKHEVHTPRFGPATGSSRGGSGSRSLGRRFPHHNRSCRSVRGTPLERNRIAWVSRSPFPCD